MRIKNIILACLVACMYVLPAGAWSRYDFRQKDIGLTFGVNMPMYSDVGSDAVVGITYGCFKDNGVGFRTGLQFTPNSAKVGNSFAVPVAFAYRFQGRDPWKRASSSRRRDIFGRDGRENSAWTSFSNLFSNSEFLIGLTPGYVPGKYNIDRKDSRTPSDTEYWTRKWTDCQDNFSVSFDAGLSLNIPVWKFDLKIIPAFHYNLTNNYYIYTAEGNSTTSEETLDGSKAIKWFFSLNAGVAFRF